jgi:hypothetical protein
MPCQVLVAWIMDQAPLGHKLPLPGHPRLEWCPACSSAADRPKLDSQHVFFVCEKMDTVRENVGIASFISECRTKGFSQRNAMSAYVRGYNSSSKRISMLEHMKRGSSLLRLQYEWLASWQ